LATTAGVETKGPARTSRVSPSAGAALRGARLLTSSVLRAREMSVPGTAGCSRKPAGVF
jgi:hypothetical protein